MILKGRYYVKPNDIECAYRKSLKAGGKEVTGGT
jgi:hypothetical protein